MIHLYVIHLIPVAVNQFILGDIFSGELIFLEQTPFYGCSQQCSLSTESTEGNVDSVLPKDATY